MQTRMKKRLLIMDDDSSVRDSLQKVLQDSGYDVMLAVDGKDGFAKLCEGAFDLLVLDVDMPGHDGWEVLEFLAMINPLLPVIMITGLMDQMETNVIPGVSALMEKPLDVPSMLGKVKELTEQTTLQRLRAAEMQPWICTNPPRS